MTSKERQYYSLHRVNCDRVISGDKQSYRVITKLLIHYKYSCHSVLLKGQYTHCLFSNSLPPDTNHIKVHGYSNINLIHTNIQPPPEGVLYQSRYILVCYDIMLLHEQ